MNKANRYLSGILLLLIGVAAGMLMVIYQEERPDDRAEVQTTEIKYSSKPIFSDEELRQVDDQFFFQNIAERVKPTVVYIETEVPITREHIPDDELHEEERDFWGQVFPRRAHAVGSGIIISSDGYILTNNHVIERAVEEGIEVTLNDKRTFSARVVGTDPSTDLAVMKIDARDLPAITVGNSNEVRVGEWVLAIGNPFRLRSTVTAGIVSALSRDMRIIQDRMRIESFIQTDAAINKGNSGGALVNTSGELIGVNTAIASMSGNYQGYGFAAPSNLALKVARDLIEYGEVHRAMLGVAIRTVDAEVAEELAMDRIQGVLIQEIRPGGAADKFGLKRNDVVLSVNKSAVNESNQLQQKIAVLTPGEMVQLKIWREGQELDKRVELGAMESDQVAQADSIPEE